MSNYEQYCTTSTTFEPLFSGIPNLTYFDGTFNSLGDGHITKFYLYPINFISEIPQEVKKLAELSVYPNPTQSIINVKLKDTAERTFYYIYNTLGQKVQEGFIEGSKAEIELPELPQGVCILEMAQKDLKESVKFIKNGY